MQHNPPHSLESARLLSKVGGPGVSQNTRPFPDSAQKRKESRDLWSSNRLLRIGQEPPLESFCTRAPTAAVVSDPHTPVVLSVNAPVSLPPGFIFARWCGRCLVGWSAVLRFSASDLFAVFWCVRCFVSWFAVLCWAFRLTLFYAYLRNAWILSNHDFQRQPKFR